LRHCLRLLQSLHALLSCRNLLHLHFCGCLQSLDLGVELLFFLSLTLGFRFSPVSSFQLVQEARLDLFDQDLLFLFGQALSFNLGGQPLFSFGPSPGFSDCALKGFLVLANVRVCYFDKFEFLLLQAMERIDLVLQVFEFFSPRLRGHGCLIAQGAQLCQVLFFSHCPAISFLFFTDASCFNRSAMGIGFSFFLGGLNFGTAALKFEFGLLERLFFGAQIVVSDGGLFEGSGTGSPFELSFEIRGLRRGFRRGFTEKGFSGLGEMLQITTGERGH
jgi:hypothetical protein